MQRAIGSIPTIRLTIASATKPSPLMAFKKGSKSSPTCTHLRQTQSPPFQEINRENVHTPYPLPAPFYLSPRRRSGRERGADRKVLANRDHPDPRQGPVFHPHRSPGGRGDS